MRPVYSLIVGLNILYKINIVAYFVLILKSVNKAKIGHFLTKLRPFL
jgi:hypothetical protein